MNNVELIDALREAKKHFWTQPQIELYPMMEAAADALETSEKNRMYLFDRVCELEEDNSELKELVPKWISVKDWLPPSNELVIVSIYDTHGDTAFRYSSTGWLTSDTKVWVVDDEENSGVTHWMKLPEMPKGE